MIIVPCVQTRNIEASVTLCGIPRVNGFYRPALPVISTALVEHRKTMARGTGKEQSRFKHITAPYFLVCTATAAPTGVLNDSLVMATPVESASTTAAATVAVTCDNDVPATPTRESSIPSSIDAAAANDDAMGAGMLSESALTDVGPTPAPIQHLRWTIVDEQQVICHL